jgi:hypothetical protein
MRYRIPMNDREIAGAILLRLANHPESHHDRFCLSYAYDYDAAFIGALADDLGLQDIPSGSFIRRLRKVCRHLEMCGILSGRITSCHAEYLGEPRMLKSYTFSNPSYALRLAPEKWPNYKPMGKVETELKILLDRCYQEDENDRTTS